MDDAKRYEKREQAHKNHFQNTACQLPFLRFWKNFSNSFFQYADQIADDAYRVVQPSWIANEQIQKKPCREGE